MFLRFGYAVGHAGLVGALMVIVIGHLVTVPTALAIAEIATNRKVEGGGEYFIVSRSFGRTIGATIGLPLYLSQAVSVAFYMIAFAEAFTPLTGSIESYLGMAWDPRIISVPATLVLVVLILTRGADLGVKALWVVVMVLGSSLALFFLGSAPAGANPSGLNSISPVADHDPFMLVFAICFPAFTGMTAGVGLSGDLKNPRRSIPLGILTATFTGLLVYIAIVFKLAFSATPEMLAEDQLIMSRIALWGPIIPIGLACATVSSAIGSILVAPRTLQALAKDEFIPRSRINRFLSLGIGDSNEPRNATLITSALALATVFMGSVDFVARIISMFFMVTYGALCAISFLEHFAARPSYRPSFRSKWYLSLLGALMCLLLMLQMDLLYALLSLFLITAVYVALKRSTGGDDLSEILRGVMNQATRYMQIRLQKSLTHRAKSDWRPSIIMVNGRTFERSAPLKFLSWLCYRYGFGTYLHYIPGHLAKETTSESRRVLRQLISDVAEREDAIFVDTIVSPSMRSALAQSLQVPGVSGMENNTAMFEFSKRDSDEVVQEVQEGSILAASAFHNILVLRHTRHFFGNRNRIHLWLTWHDYQNASLMILLAYILLGHPDWRRAEVRIFAAYPRERASEETEKLRSMVQEGRIPVSLKNVRIIATDDRMDFSRMVESNSREADLVILGFSIDQLQARGPELLRRHDELRDVLFVSAQEEILIE